MLKNYIADVRLTQSDRDVYEPSDDSFVLVDALILDATSWPLRRPRLCGAATAACLEVGSGSGYVITSLARLLQHLGIRACCFATDINPAAIAATQQTLAAHKVDTVDIVCADLTEPFKQRLCAAVDLLVFNPPYVPTPEDEVQRDGLARAWAGGHRGRVVIDRFLPMVSHLLSPKGRLFMVTVADNKPAEILSILKQHGLAGKIVLTRRADEEFLSIIQANFRQDDSISD